MKTEDLYCCGNCNFYADKRNGIMDNTIISNFKCKHKKPIHDVVYPWDCCKNWEYDSKTEHNRGRK